MSPLNPFHAYTVDGGADGERGPGSGEESVKGDCGGDKVAWLGKDSGDDGRCSCILSCEEDLKNR